MSFISFSLLFLLLFHFHPDLVKPSSEVASQGQHVIPYFQTPLDHKDKYRFFWSLDYKAAMVTIEVRAELHHKMDWFGVGFSDYGNITKADMCILWFDKKPKAHFEDVWTDENGYVNIDDNNDCMLLNITRKGAEVKFVYQRKFETCDPADYIIEDGTTHIVYATGKGPLKRLTDLKLTETTHGFQRVQLLKNIAPLPVLPKDTRAVEVVHQSVFVPDEETTYWCSLHMLPEELKDKHHIIQYEAIVEKGNEALVHHMEIFHCEVAADEVLPEYSGSCFAKNKPAILENCKRVIAAWAMGAGPIAYPEEAGLPIGGANFSRYVMLEIHYNNPEKRFGAVDSSGARLYYTNKLRANDVGILEIGLEYTDKNSIPPREAGFDLSGYCVAECTRAGLPSDGITIFASQLHTHLTGVRVWTKHVRGGTELPEVNRDNHYSQHFQEIRLLKNPVKVLPGDSLINTCRYDTTSRVNMTLGGFAISDEMCVNYLHYYPKVDLEVCKSSIDGNILANYFDYMRSFENSKTSPAYGISKNYHSIEWNPNRAKFLRRLYESSPLDMQCNRSNGERFPGFWGGVQLTQIYRQLEKAESVCDEV